MASREAKGTTKGRVRQTGVNLMTTHPTDIPQSAFRDPQSRHALTLAEVLIAMGIMTIGLLGVASVFPVGGHYIQTGDVADRAGAVAQAALEDAVVQGHLDPENWIVHDINRTTGNPGLFMRLVSGEAPGPNDATRNRVVLGLRAALVDASLPPSVLGVARSTPEANRAALHGGAYVIDPLGMMSALADPATGNTITANPFNSAPIRHFPAFGGLATRAASGPGSPMWNHWLANGLTWPVRRATVLGSMPLMNGSANNAGQFSRALPTAVEMFSTRDDLALSLPAAGEDPARQLWRRGALGAPSTRQSARNFSWVVSVAPGSSVERNAIATRPDSYPVEVSSVVFHKRATGRGVEAALQAERLVNARLVSSGGGAGELLLERRAPGASGVPDTQYTREPTTSPFEDLRSGEYLMVVAPHPLSSEVNPRLGLRWCRVLSVQDSGTVEVGAARRPYTLSRDQRVLVSLRGPDWPWQPAADPTDLTQLSNDLRVAIVPGAVAVHTKTMRLEAGSEWSVD